MLVDLKKVKRIYFIGIKGVAMSGLAVICKNRGMAVAGSDMHEKFITDKILRKNNIKVFENFSATNLDFNPDLVVIGTSWGDDNVEVLEVKKRNLNFITDSEMRGLLSREKRTIAITGVHGKTTTTAMLSYLFSQAGLDPSFLIGTGNVPDLGGNAFWGQGEHFIVEGDEYVRSRDDKTPKFLDLSPTTSIITSIEWEHVDIYPNLVSIEEPFRMLINKTRKMVVACGDWPSVRKVIKDHGDKVVTYGLEKDNFWQAENISLASGKTSFHVKKNGADLGEFKIKLCGPHNVSNTLSVIIVGLSEGIRIEQIRKILPNFKGAQRRFDVSVRKGIIFVDDYGHHPTEIKTTLESIRHCYPDKIIWCVFQPHMVSRTKALLGDFAQSFGDANQVFFADIFASAREIAKDITSQDLAREVKKYHKQVTYSGDLDQTIDYLKDKIKPGMVLVTMGAGDVYRVRDKLLS